MTPDRTQLSNRWLEFTSQRTDADDRRQFTLHYLRDFSNDRRQRSIVINKKRYWPRAQCFWANPVRYIEKEFRVGAPPWNPDQYKSAQKEESNHVGKQSRHQ